MNEEIIAKCSNIKTTNMQHSYLCVVGCNITLYKHNGNIAICALLDVTLYKHNVWSNII